MLSHEEHCELTIRMINEPGLIMLVQDRFPYEFDFVGIETFRKVQIDTRGTYFATKLPSTGKFLGEGLYDLVAGHYESKTMAPLSESSELVSMTQHIRKMCGDARVNDVIEYDLTVLAATEEGWALLRTPIALDWLENPVTGVVSEQNQVCFLFDWYDGKIEAYEIQPSDFKVLERMKLGSKLNQVQFDSLCEDLKEWCLQKGLYEQ